MHEYARQHNQVVYHRQPTSAEIKFGYGAIHYGIFDKDYSPIRKKDGSLKKWFKCPNTGLRYYR